MIQYGVSSIERLAELGKVAVHITDVSWREFINQQEDHFEEQLGKLEETIRELHKKILSAELLEGLCREIESLQTKYEEVAKEFNPWLAGLGVQVRSVVCHSAVPEPEKGLRNPCGRDRIGVKKFK